MKHPLTEYSIEIHCVGVTCLRDVTLYICPFELCGHRASRPLGIRDKTFKDFREAMKTFEELGHKRKFSTMGIPEYGECVISKVVLVGSTDGLTWRTLTEI